MVYFKSALIALCTVLFGCVITPILMLIWASWKNDRDEIAIGFSPMGLAHSVSFWIFIFALSAAGSILSALFLKKG